MNGRKGGASWIIPSTFFQSLVSHKGRNEWIPIIENRVSILGVPNFCWESWHPELIGCMLYKPGERGRTWPKAALRILSPWETLGASPTTLYPCFPLLQCLPPQEWCLQNYLFCSQIIFVKQDWKYPITTIMTSVVCENCIQICSFRSCKLWRANLNLSVICELTRNNMPKVSWNSNKRCMRKWNITSEIETQYCFANTNTFSQFLCVLVKVTF